MVAVQVPLIEQDPVMESKSIFYMERILELLSKHCFVQAKTVFYRYHKYMEQMLSPEHFQQMRHRVDQNDDWSTQKENQFQQLLQSAQTSRIPIDIHDYATELLAHIEEPSSDSCTQESYLRLQRVLAENYFHYIDPDEITINTFINAKVEFVVESRRASRDNDVMIDGDPGFYLTDSMDNTYRCFIKQVSGVEVGSTLRLKITNIPGMSIKGKQAKEKIIYLEPRIEPGDSLEIEVMNVSHTGNSFTFRHHSYDGFLWFKRRGVNKKDFNQNNIKPKDKILAKVLYTSDDIKRSKSGQITRLGIVKAIPLKRLDC